MFAHMENIDPQPSASEAREALATIDGAQRAVRDTPWPAWIYPTNAVLLGALALAALLEQDRRFTAISLMFAIVGINLLAGYRTGVPSAVPTSRAFVVLVALAGACAAGAYVVAEVTEATWPVVVLAVLATAGYLLAGAAHRASTGSAT